MMELREVLGEGKRPLESMARAIGPAHFDPLSRAMGPREPARAVPAEQPPRPYLPRVAPGGRAPRSVAADGELTPNPGRGKSPRSPRGGPGAPSGVPPTPRSRVRRG